MSRACCATPRKIFPPPTTMAICAPILSASASSSAISCTRWDSRPKPCVPARASPDSLSRMRWNAGVGMIWGLSTVRSSAIGLLADSWRPKASLLFFRFHRGSEGHCSIGIAHFEAGEAAHADILTQLADLGGDKLRDGSGLVLDERLFTETNFLVDLRHLAFHNLLDHIRRLAGSSCLGAINVLLALERLRRHILAADKLRIAGGNVHGDVVQQLLEIIRARHEIALAVHFQQHANLSARVDVVAHRAFTCHARRLLSSQGNAPLAQVNNGLLHVAFRLNQGLLAIHHRSPALIAEFFYLCSRNIHSRCAHKR